MAISLQNVAVEQFSIQFENEYQANKGQIPMSVMNVRGVVGDVYHAKLAGEIIMHDRGAFQSDIPPSDVTYNDIQLTFKNKTALVPSDIFEQAEVNASERQNLARSSAMSIARQEDQIVIDDGLVAGFGNTVAAVGTNLNVNKMREAQAILNRNNVPMNDRFATIHANSLQALLGETEVTSSDFNTVKALVQGEIDTFLGFKFIILGNRTEGGLPVAANIRDTFFYQKSALMAAYGVLDQGGNPGVTIDWDPRSQSYLVIPKLRMGSKTIQGDGIVKVLCDEA